MPKIISLNPFMKKLNGSKLRLVFAHQDISILKNGELYQFLPVEGKEIIIDIGTVEVQNLKEVFVFQNGNRFIRMPLYELMVVCNMEDKLGPYVEDALLNKSPQVSEYRENTNSEVEEIVIRSLIDRALDVNDKAAFMKLSEQLKNLNKMEELTC